jgi:hypothetical protein
VPIRAVKPRKRAYERSGGDGVILLQIKEMCEQLLTQERESAGKLGMPLIHKPKNGVRKVQNYSSGRRNSNPNRRNSPMASCHLTLAAIGGVSLGMRLEEA